MDESQPPAPRRSAQNTLRERAKTSRKISWLLDECIRIPGTKIRFGIDPLLGLLPYGGEAAATLVGGSILAEAGKKGIPIKTLLRMGGNSLLNALVGTIPIAGDAFSFWFKSNSRNYRMLNEFLDSEEGRQAEGGWWPILVVAGILVLLIGIVVTGWVVMFSLATKLFGPFLQNIAGG